MFGSPLYNSEYQAQFSGHETFPMRYGWLKKAYDATRKAQLQGSEGSVFNDPSAIASFGVGKNMVTSIRHWAANCDVIEKGNEPKVRVFGQKILDEKGLDPYMEFPATMWLLHWKLASNKKLTTWYWVFNHFSSTNFERERLVDGLVKLGSAQGWPRMSRATIKRDVECFVRTYAAKPLTGKLTHEDTMESPLTELSLIKAIGKKDGFRIIRGPKPTLGNGVFAYAVSEFWNSHSSSNTLSLEALAHQPGSPGRIFQLNEEDLNDRLSRIDTTTNEKMRWSETAGLRQLVRTSKMSEEESLDLIATDYTSSKARQVA